MFTGDSTLAENLKPPFIVSMLRDKNTAKRISNFSLRPSDEMVSLAPSQKGFLGVETMRDGRGEWFTLAYWKNLQDFNAWWKVCEKELSVGFHGEPFESLCSITITDVKTPIAQKSTRHLKADKPATSLPHSNNRVPRFSNLLPLLTEFFGHVSIRQSR